jgi:hypothetical protein
MPDGGPSSKQSSNMITLAPNKSGNATHCNRTRAFAFTDSGFAFANGKCDAVINTAETKDL